MSGNDLRTAAFLHEMGITPLWTRRDAPAQAPSPESEAAAPEAQVAPPLVAAAPRPDRRALETPPVSSHFGPQGGAVDSAWGDDPAPAPATDDEIARMDWAELKTAIATCSRCGLCKGGRKPVYGDGARQALWLVAAGASTAADEQAGAPLSGDAGKLLDNMLAAVGLSRASTVYVTNLVKCRPTSATGGERAPSADEAAACKPFLERERSLTGAAMVLTLGQIAANALQGKALAEPLAGSRGQVHALGEANLVATLHPGELLRRGGDKALAWADLCLARAHDGRPG